MRTRDIILIKQIHSCFASASSSDVWIFKWSLHRPKTYSQKILLPSYAKYYVGSDETFYHLGLKNFIFSDYKNTPEFNALVQSYLQDGWFRRSELPKSYEDEEKAWTKEIEARVDIRRKRRGCVLVGKENFTDKDYQGGFSKEVFEVEYLQNYIASPGVGYIGSWERTFKTDRELERKFRRYVAKNLFGYIECKLHRIDVDGYVNKLLAVWLTSSGGRHFADNLGGSFRKDRITIDSRIQEIFDQAFKWGTDAGVKIEKPVSNYRDIKL